MDRKRNNVATDKKKAERKMKKDHSKMVPGATSRGDE
jgi:hypothetical protein